MLRYKNKSHPGKAGRKPLGLHNFIVRVSVKTRAEQEKIIKISPAKRGEILLNYVDQTTTE